jgi:hypothetical protein
MAQLLERIILIKNPMLTKTNNYQFGSKKNTSCHHAMFILKETIAWYINNKSAVRIASLDAEKANDWVWRNGLFFKLIKKLDFISWRLFVNYYEYSNGVIYCNNRMSNMFQITCGVKQGGILSPYLFNLFIDDLIIECIHLKVGGLLYGKNVSIIMYADDIILISTSDTHLQILLSKCEEYASKWNIKFNTKKSMVMSKCLWKCLWKR